MTKIHLLNPGLCALALIISSGAAAAEPETWTIVVGEVLQNEEAVSLAADDLKNAGAALGLRFSSASDNALPKGNVLIVGAPARNRLCAQFADAGRLIPPARLDEEGYCIQTVHEGARRIVAVMGGAPLGEAYGLYWVWDRLRVNKRLPDLNVTRAPAFKVRMGIAWGREGYGGSNREQMRMSLRHSVNWVAGPAVLDLVPWDSEPERSANERNRENARELFAYAHSLHMKCLSFANEFTYHPSLLQKHGASLSPCDPKFWDALQAKFRMLFQALPELDAIELCNDDLSGFWDNYQVYDLLHENAECDWSYEKRFRTFVQKIHEVTVGEFGKTYFHFTWGLSPNEQHVQPAAYRAIFTDALPANNLYLIPKITMGDRWWRQPYNTTFNLTPHETLVCFETMNYYEGGATPLFPTFSGQYFQSGLQMFLAPPNNNVRGLAVVAGTGETRWDTLGAYAYVLYRLMWNPDEDIESIARDFCSIHFGPSAAESMARIFLLSPNAYAYGLWIEPVAAGQFNSLLHMRVGEFIVEGRPLIDRGREHIAFLRSLYLRCKPWREETLADLDHGLATAEKMQRLYSEAKPLIQDPALADNIEQRLDLTRLLILTNNRYVRLMFAFFDYWDTGGEAELVQLKEAAGEMEAARDSFVHAPGFSYDLDGIDLLRKIAAGAIDNIAAAKADIESAPTRAEFMTMADEMQRRYAEVFEKHREKVVRFAHVEAQVDGEELLHVSGGEMRLEHLRWDPGFLKVNEITKPLPRTPVTVVPKTISSRPLYPFVVDQPREENGYTARIYLIELPGGPGWMNFDLYYIEERPEALGLIPPWEN